MSFELSTEGPGKTFNAVQNYFDGKNATWGKERKGKVWKHEKWHKNIYFATVMRPSWDLFWFLFRENTHCLITDFKSTVNKNTLTSSVHKGFKIPPAKQNHLLYRTFLFLSWLWQNKLTNQNHGLNRQSKKTIPRSSDICKVTLVGNHWVSRSRAEVFYPLDPVTQSSFSSLHHVSHR